MLINTALALMLAGLVAVFSGTGAGVHLVLAGMAAISAWALRSLFR